MKDDGAFEDPFQLVLDEILEPLSEVLKIGRGDIRVEIPPKPEMGDLALPLHGLSKRLSTTPQEILSRVSGALEKSTVVAKFELVSGYLNLWLSTSEISRILFRALERLGSGYGIVRTRDPKRYVVEYVSANPVHPLHIGSGRNAALGIALYSMLRLRGHHVETTFYVNDLGRQVATMVLGFKLLGMPRPPPGLKEDHWIGHIYASTNVILEILSIKRRLEQLKNDPESYREALKELDELMADAARLRETNPTLFDNLLDNLSRIEDPEAEISRLMQAYERASDEEVVRIFRKAVNMCLDGFKKTLSLVGADIGRWDFESDLAWEGIVDQVIQASKGSPYFGYHKGAPALVFDKILEIPGIREELRLPRTLEIPPLILMRSDETTLYTVRDIGYSIKKFSESRADYVINVVASEQILPQAQLRLALYALGFKKEASRLIHYSYEIVSLPGQRMSGRRGRYVSLDQVLESSVKRSIEILRQRGSEGGENIASRIGISAVKYALASISPSKPVVFKLDEALNFERNSAPYIMYTYARASSILEKAGDLPGLDEVDLRAGEANSKRRQLLIEILRAPGEITRAIDDLRPEDIASKLSKISDLFNSWYQEDQVLKEPDRGARAYKLHLVLGIKAVLGNGLRALGIEPLERI